MPPVTKDRITNAQNPPQTAAQQPNRPPAPPAPPAAGPAGDVQDGPQGQENGSEGDQPGFLAAMALEVTQGLFDSVRRLFRLSAEEAADLRDSINVD